MRQVAPGQSADRSAHSKRNRLIPGTQSDVTNSNAGWRWQKWHLWLLVAGLLLRVAFALTVDKESSFGGWDGKEYYAYGQSLLALRWDNYPRFFNNIRPPFYPIFLTPFLAVNDQIVWHIQLFQCGLGVLQAFILAKVVGRWLGQRAGNGDGQRAGNWAFVIALFHPFLIYYCGFVLTETLFITLLWFGIACLQRLADPGQENQTRWLVGGAVALGLGCLTRPTLQLFLPIAALWIGWRVWRSYDWMTGLKRMAAFTAIVSALLLPWMIGNLCAHGEFTLAPGNTQVSYAFSNSPEYLRMYESKTKQEYYENFEGLIRKFSVESGTSPETWIAEARDFRQNHREEWWRLQAFKFKHFWTPWLNPLIFSRANVLISLVTITPLFLLGALELVRRRRIIDPFLVLLLGLIAVGYLVGGFLFHVQVRYRFPYVDLTLMILSASLLGQLQLSKLRDLKLVRMLRPVRA
ncbi:MAG TPA: glycosyltransferase family 39 protein [Pyrinomonadaceae bacterium]